MLAEARRTRLELDKLVKARKEEIRGETVAGGIAALREHTTVLAVTHRPAFLDIATRVYQIDEGTARLGTAPEPAAV